MKICICISGKGGQGIRKVGECLAEASLLKGLNVLQVNIYTPEVRGGSSNADIIISKEKIYYPLIEEIDILLVFHPDAYHQNLKRINKNTFIIYDSDAVSVSKPCKSIGFPFSDIAKKEFKQPIFSNMIGLGVLIKTTNIIEPEFVLRILQKKKPQLTENSIQAFLKGLELVDEKRFYCRN